MDVIKRESSFPSMRDQRLNVDNRHFNVIFVLAFIFYLPIFSVARFLPVKWCSPFLRTGRRRGVIEQTRAQANLLASYATMN